MEGAPLGFSFDGEALQVAARTGSEARGKASPTWQGKDEGKKAGRGDSTYTRRWGAPPPARSAGT